LRFAVLPVAVVLLAGTAIAANTSTVRRQLEFARFQSSSFGIVALYNVTSVRSGKSYKFKVLVTNGYGSWRDVTPPNTLLQLEDVYFSTPLTGWVAANDCVMGHAAVYRTPGRRAQLAIDCRAWGELRGRLSPRPLVL